MSFALSLVVSLGLVGTFMLTRRAILRIPRGYVYATPNAAFLTALVVLAIVHPGAAADSAFEWLQKLLILAMWPIGMYWLYDYALRS
ncbi:MAG TPA: hypothetical protein V6D08_08505 [Candidatus Obscuribacterales bacterium]